MLLSPCLKLGKIYTDKHVFGEICKVWKYLPLLPTHVGKEEEKQILFIM